MSVKKIIFKIGWSLTRLGDKYNLRFLTYNPFTWALFYISGRRSGRIFSQVVKEQFPDFQSALDVGAGTGGYVSSLSQRGLRAIGVEYSAVGRLLGKLQGATLTHFDCSRPEALPSLGHFDLVFSIEVGEHLPENLSENFVDFVAGHGDFVIFSAAFPGQGGHGHINEKPKEFWQELFSQRGFMRDLELEESLSARLLELNFRGWLPHNLLALRRFDKIDHIRVGL